MERTPTGLCIGARVAVAEIDALFHGMLEDRQSEEEVRSTP